MTWQEAERICGAASRPYNLIFQLMLECGWGIGEFLKFNTVETWQQIRNHLTKNPQAEYYRHEFPARKRNTHPFYTLIQTARLKEILSLTPVPIKASRGLWKVKGVKQPKRNDTLTLNMEGWNPARQYLENAWRTARRRAPVKLAGKPTIHELRDTFRTRATQAGCAPEAAEFAIGHTIDPLGYNKCFYDEKWMWNELRKISAPNEAIDESTFQQKVKEYVDSHFKELVDERFNELVRQRQLTD